ncbi:MAG: molybdenum cofactor biosynthesis protein [Deltaproteobacteria bacterium]|nr:molybdenum cofactor biosynthesis protein [Deltaproteobacteria bacterium]
MAVHEHKEKAPAKVNVMVITVSDTRDEKTDQSGQLIKEMLSGAGHRITGYHIVKDEPTEIDTLLRGALAREGLEAIILNGGTGIAPRDGTYEVVDRLFQKKLDGFGEIFRFLSYQDIGPAAIMSRACAGICGNKVMISLPGSRGAVQLAMERLVLPELGHMVSQLRG